MKYPVTKLVFLLPLLLCFAFSTLKLSGQNGIIDSIRLELQQFDDDSLRLDHALSRARSATIPLALIYVQEGKNIAKRLASISSMIEVLTEEAILQNRQGNHMAGVKSFLKVDSLSRILNDTIKMAAVQTNLGLSYFYGGTKDQALQHYYDAYQLYQKISEPRGYSRLLNNLAICSKEVGKLKESLQYYRESYQLKQTLADSSGMATSLMNLGLLLAELDRYEEAIDTLQFAHDQYLAIAAYEDAAACQMSLGKIMIDYGQWDRAHPHVQHSYEYFLEYSPQSQNMLLALGDLATISIRRNDWPQASAHLEEALRLARQSDKLEILKSLLKNKAKVDYALHHYQNGFDALQESYNLSDSINTDSKLALIEEMQTRFAVDAKEKEIALLNAQSDLDKIKLQTTKSRNLLLILIGLALGLFSVFLYRLYRQIDRQKQVISKTLSERETLLKEIHHRVKNNLQVISSLLSMQSYHIKDDHALAAIQESRNRVKSMSLIHQSLYQDRDLLSIDSSEYIINLAKGLFDSYNIDQERISLNTVIDPVQLDVDIMIPLGLILNELISNALKYAFTDGRKGELKVSLFQHTSQLTLEVSDNGVGLPEDFNARQPLSLGHTLVQDFCKKLKAELKINGMNGTKVMIAIPNINEK